MVKKLQWCLTQLENIVNRFFHSQNTVAYMFWCTSTGSIDQFFSHERVAATAATANLVLASCFLTVLAYPAYLLGVNDMLLKEKLTRYENRCYHLYEINSYSLIFQINESWICCQSTEKVVLCFSVVWWTANGVEKLKLSTWHWMLNRWEKSQFWSQLRTLVRPLVNWTWISQTDLLAK